MGSRGVSFAPIMLSLDSASPTENDASGCATCPLTIPAHLGHISRGICIAQALTSHHTKPMPTTTPHPQKRRRIIRHAGHCSPPSPPADIEADAAPPPVMIYYELPRLTAFQN